VPLSTDVCGVLPALSVTTRLATVLPLPVGGVNVTVKLHVPPIARGLVPHGLAGTLK
jgi:hypothetical protein